MADPGLVEAVDTEFADTARLVRRAQDGDRDALERAFARVRPRLEKWIALRVGPRLRSRLDIEDIVQLTLTAAWERLDYLDVRDSPSLFAWFKEIARNRIRDLNDWACAAKRDARREEYLERSLGGGWTSPSVGASRRAEHERLLTVLQNLPEQYRSVLQLVRLEGMSYAEASEVLGISVNLVGVRLVRALDALRQAVHRSRPT